MQSIRAHSRHVAVHQRCRPRAPVGHKFRCASAANTEQDLESAVELFMRRQAELESGGESGVLSESHRAMLQRTILSLTVSCIAAFARTARDPNAIIGADQVSEDAAKTMCAEIFDVLRTLKETRDMSVAEIKLVVSIEDPRTRERRAKADIEDSRGVSRDEMAAALIEVAEGRVPKDRIALRCLHEEIAEWPFLDINTPLTGGFSTASAADKEVQPKTSPSDYAGLLKGGDTVVKPYIMGQEARNKVEGEKPQDLADMMPAWMGYGALYGISFIPVLLVIMTVLVLFYNSLK